MPHNISLRSFHLQRKSAIPSSGGCVWTSLALRSSTFFPGIMESPCRNLMGLIPGRETPSYEDWQEPLETQGFFFLGFWNWKSAFPDTLRVQFTDARRPEGSAVSCWRLLDDTVRVSIFVLPRILATGGLGNPAAIALLRGWVGGFAGLSHSGVAFIGAG